jgi:transcriptional regulator with XRE-family HTH domain
MIARTTGSLTFGIEIVHANVWLIDTWAARVHSPTMAGVGAAHRIYGTFGAQVRERRTAMGLTQLDLAARINLTRGSVANIEAGRQSVLLHQFMDIANALVMNPAQRSVTRYRKSGHRPFARAPGDDTCPTALRTHRAARRWFVA